MTKEINSLVLAFLGDTIYEDYIREYLIKTGCRNVKELQEMPILLPSLEEQNRIVSILDRFDKLINDIFIGLPAEIELRRKQYEYYRNKLLSFEELSVSE